MRLGSVLFGVQRRLGLKQKEFAAELGVSPSCLSLWRRGRRKPGFFKHRGILAYLAERWPEEYTETLGGGQEKGGQNGRRGDGHGKEGKEGEEEGGTGDQETKDGV